MNIWELRLVTEDDQTELGMRVACALYAENENDQDTAQRMIVWRSRMGVRKV